MKKIQKSMFYVKKRKKPDDLRQCWLLTNIDKKSPLNHIFG